jgi:hypothetical protein
MTGLPRRRRRPVVASPPRHPHLCPRPPCRSLMASPPATPTSAPAAVPPLPHVLPRSTTWWRPWATAPCHRLPERAAADLLCMGRPNLLNLSASLHAHRASPCSGERATGRLHCAETLAMTAASVGPRPAQARRTCGSSVAAVM